MKATKQRSTGEVTRRAARTTKKQQIIASYLAGTTDIEELARKDPKFNYLLGGVWRNAMTDEVWQRLQAIRNHVW